MDNETWWCNDEVQKTIQRKRLAKKSGQVSEMKKVG